MKNTIIFLTNVILVSYSTSYEIIIIIIIIIIIMQ